MMSPSRTLSLSNSKEVDQITFYRFISRARISKTLYALNSIDLWNISLIFIQIGEKHPIGPGKGESESFRYIHWWENNPHHTMRVVYSGWRGFGSCIVFTPFFIECFIVFRYECNTQLQTIVNSVLGDHNLVLTFENLSLIEDRVIYVDIRDDDEKYGTNKMFLVGIERNYINWDPQSSIIFKRSDWVFSFDSSMITVVSPRDSLDWTIHTTIGKVSRASYRYNSYKELKEHKHVYRWEWKWFIH